MTTITYRIVLLAYVSLPCLNVSAVTHASCLRCRRIFNFISSLSLLTLDCIPSQPHLSSLGVLLGFLKHLITPTHPHTHTPTQKYDSDLEIFLVIGQLVPVCPLIVVALSIMLEDWSTLRASVSVGCIADAFSRQSSPFWLSGMQVEMG